MTEIIVVIINILFIAYFLSGGSGIVEYDFIMMIIYLLLMSYFVTGGNRAVDDD